MRRVVVTGLGLVTPLADGVEESWSRLIAGESGAGPITRFDASNVATTYACEVPHGDGSDGTFNPDTYMEPKERRKVDDFIVYGIAAADQAVKDSGWQPEDEGKPAAHRRFDRVWHWWASIHRTDNAADCGKRPTPGVAVLHSRGVDQSDQWSGEHPLWFQRSEPFRCDRLFDGGACDWRRLTPDWAGRRRCYAGRRGRSGDLPDRHCRVQCLQGIVHQARRYAERGQPPL